MRRDERPRGIGVCVNTAYAITLRIALERQFIVRSSRFVVITPALRTVNCELF